MDRDAVLERLEELRRHWLAADEKFKIAKNADPVQALVVIGLESHVHALIDAARLLIDAKHEVTVLPLVRQALECSLVALWVALVPDGVDSVLTTTLRNRRLIAKEFVRDGHPDAAELLRRIEEEAERGVEASSPRRLEQRAKELSGGERWYTVYRVISQYCHADQPLAELYLDQIDEAPGVKLRKAARPINIEFWLVTLPAAAIIAGLAVDQLDRNHHRRRFLRDAADAEGISKIYNTEVRREAPVKGAGGSHA